MRKAALFFLFLPFFALSQEDESYPDNLRFSQEAQVGCFPCLDTMKIFGFKHVADLRPMLPSWRPVVSHDTSVILEGRVMPFEGHIGPSWGTPHVSYEDLPLYHYTHDIGINVWPDKGYRNLMSRYVNVELNEVGEEIRDTVIRPYVHCEWESGLAAANKGNPASDSTRFGSSFGFASEGHQRYDVIWNWPTIDDWVHLEGLWIWDRGHPPARTEVHPIRFLAIRRNLPEKIEAESRPRYATRVDIFANGDGSPFYNNWDTSAFVHPVNMSEKDYSFVVRNTLAKPDGAQLKFQLKDRKGNTFGEDAQVQIYEGTDSARITIPWKTLDKPNSLVFAQTVYLYWDGESSTTEEITEFEVSLEKFRVRRLSEIWFLNRAELRIFFNVGSDYIFFNEFATKRKDIMRKGLGKTNKRRWKVDQKFNLSVPVDKRYRVYAAGWEADGVDKILGHIIDQYSPCTPEVKEYIDDKMLDPTPVGYGGCEDDNMGEAVQYHRGNEESGTFIIKGDGKPYTENCPLGNRTPIDFHRLHYSITKE